MNKIWLSFFIIFSLIALNGCSHGGIYASTSDEHFLLLEEVSGIEDEVWFYFFGIPKGEATLIKGKDRHILVDTGHPESWEALNNMLLELHIEKIDFLFLTSDDPLYSGNAHALINDFDVSTVIMSEVMLPSIEKMNLTKEVNVTPAKKGDHYKVADHLTIEILHPGEQYSRSPQNNSLVLRVIHDQLKALFTSGIHAEAEMTLVEGYELKSQILKVSAGGSFFGSSEPFLQDVDAHIAIIFNHGEELQSEKAEVIERLEETWIEVFQIDRNGTIIIQSLGNDYEVFKER